ncbi:PolC-type DNA polymerase III [Proteiniborus sp. MB09-C3]|uniref:PolC-type DNA polymerase III n=1 Tax=Proteiniborus sp. MB09-C3 TaxID=3050072 RepID=UPI002553F143|nr:PolC-type DNA polymerase III [Proteiniborus sp. MB09-C3]WIV10897.1 PolC-type DNA polymerase III [Proteiniborus sp. MB09-C3]
MALLKKKTLNSLLEALGIDNKNESMSNIIIERVTVNTNNKALKLYLKSDNIITNDLIDEIKSRLLNRFIGLDNIFISMNYKDMKCSKESLIDLYMTNILDLIRNEIPSSSAWIDSIKWEASNEILNIYIGSKIGLTALHNKVMDKQIEELINDDLGLNYKIEFNYVESQLLSEEEHYKIKEIEETKMLENLLAEVNDNGKKFDSKKKNSNDRKNSGSLIYGNKIQNEIIKISDINIESGSVAIEGEIFDLDCKEIKGDKKIYTFNITDLTSSITIKIFANKKVQEVFDSSLVEGLYVKAYGDVIYDNYLRQIAINLRSLELAERTVRVDNCQEKRVELHCHTKMSAMDGVSNFSDIAKRAADWGHKALAITDHGVVQAYPEGMESAKKYGIKILYGVEGYLVNDIKPIVTYTKSQDIDTEYVVFDIETTGFSNKNDKVTEIGAVKIINGQVVDRFSQLINPKIKIPEKIIELTGITDELVANEPIIDEVLPRFIEFIGNSVLVAHNASFDTGFIRENCNRIGLVFNNTTLDTLQLSRELLPHLKSHKLNIIAKHLNVSLENHHRAVDDSEATAKIFIKLVEMLKEKGVTKLEEINTVFEGNKNIKSDSTFHIIIFAKNQNGLKTLYKIISESHLKYFHRRPRIPKSMLSKYRDDLVIGTACEAGELYKSILSNRAEDEIKDIVNFYDFLEIQPLANNMFLIDNNSVKDIDELKSINRKIVELGEEHDKPVVATGDVHFLDPHEEMYRRILLAGQGFSDADKPMPLYLRTTNEMLEEFSYLGEKKAKEVVIQNTNLIADMIEEILPIPDGTYPPVIDGVDEELRNMNYKKAKEIYGDPLPEIVQARLDRELNSIISNGYAVMYIIAQKLVTKSLSDGYLVGSRGSVGSSFVATMSDITEVNPLPPHYICENCKNCEFILDGSFSSGADLPNKICPKCGAQYKKNGHDIPFEVFLGFEGDKEPDIDLNFAGEYQPKAHQYTEEVFGKGYVFRAGTIGTIAEKTAYGYVKKYFEERNISVNNAEINRLVRGCTGIKRTSGQHPGGVMVVPNYKEIYDFTPIQYPADDSKSGVITTHFDYHSISGRILKLDILGHDVPSIIRMLEDITGINAQSIPLDDKDTLKLFTSTEPLGVTTEEINTEVGTLGVPEFGTKFVRQMLVDTGPTTFGELVRISGLSHGTDVWVNNAQDLVRNGVAKLTGVISTRDDIMLYLIYNGLDKKRSFKIMERVRKGKGLSEEDEEYMRENKIPEWYIQSCNTIKYMFPKAHAVAYVMMSFRIAYFKVHYPSAFYATYFTSKAIDFDAELALKGKEVVKNKIQELENMGNNKTAKEKNLLTVLEVVLEMYSRGLEFERVDLYKSDSDKFIIGEKGLIPPLKSLEGVGENAARSIAEERKKSEFISLEDLTSRCKITKTVLEALEAHGCLEGIPESNQLTLFNI